MRLITLYVPEGLLTELENLVERGLYPNRAEAIRLAIHDLVKNERKHRDSYPGVLKT